MNTQSNWQRVWAKMSLPLWSLFVFIVFFVLVFFINASMNVNHVVDVSRADLHDNSKLDREIIALQSKLNKASKNISLRLKLIDVLIRRGDFANARYMVAAISQKEQAPELAIAIARILMRLGDNETAMVHLRRVKETSQYHQHAILLLGEANMRVGNYLAAMAVTSQYAGNFEMDFVRARANYVLGNNIVSQNLLNLLKRNREEEQRLYQFSVRMALDMNDTTKAWDLGEKLSVLDRQLVEAEISIRDGRFDEAHRLLTDIHQQNMPSKTLYQLWGLLESNLGNDEEAMRLFNQVMDWGGGMPRDLLIRIMLKMQVGDLAQAAKLLEVYRGQAQASPMGHELRVRVELARGRSDAALVHIEKLRTDAPELAPVYALHTHLQSEFTDESIKKAMNVLEDSIWPASGSTSNSFLLDENGEQVMTAPAFLLGPYGKTVLSERAVMDRFSHLKTVMMLWQRGDIEKALASAEKLKQIYDGVVDNGEGSIWSLRREKQIFDLLLVKFRMANFDFVGAETLMRSLPESLMQTQMAQIFKTRLEELITAHDEAIDNKNLNRYAAVGVEKDIYENWFHFAQYAREDEDYFLDIDYFRTLGEFIVRDASNIGADYADDKLDGSLGSDFIKKTANAGVRYHANVPHNLLLAASLLEVAGDLDGANRVYRQYIREYPDRWAGYAQYLSFLKTKKVVRRGLSSGRNVVRKDAISFFSALSLGSGYSRERALQQALARLALSDLRDSYQGAVNQVKLEDQTQMMAFELALASLDIDKGHKQRASKRLLALNAPDDLPPYMVLEMAQMLVELGESYRDRHVLRARHLLEKAIDDEGDKSSQLGNGQRSQSWRVLLIEMRSGLSGTNKNDGASLASLSERQIDLHYARLAFLPVLERNYDALPSVKAYADALERAGLGRQSQIIRNFALRDRVGKKTEPLQPFPVRDGLSFL